MTLQSPLAKRLPKPAATPDELEAHARRALIERNFACVRLDRVDDPLTRKIIRHEAERQLGLRT